MKSILEEISKRVTAAIRELGVEGDPLVRAAQDDKFGDYQSNCAMGLAKKLGRPPRDVAADLIEKLDVADLCGTPQIAGPGFINLKMRTDFLARTLESVPSAGAPDGERMGIPRATEPETVVVDLSSPNLAKEMHVGHLRSTVIGDCVARVLEFFGHDVHRLNHVGDWGTQFGMLVAHLREVRPDVARDPEKLVISDLEAFYVEAKGHFDADQAFRETARKTVVALQGGDEDTLRLWRAFCAESLRHCHAIYDRLGVKLLDRGESFYNDLMNALMTRLEGAPAPDGSPLLVESEGAMCIFPKGFTTRDGDPLPMIMRKSDGGFNYNTSDLAALLHRVEELKATRLVYVVGLGSGNKEHFEMLFGCARMTGWVPEGVRLEHLGFGNMLAADGRPFKTREGGTIKLKDLLDKAVVRAREVVAGQTSGDDGRAKFDNAEIDEIAETIGIGAIKYFDFCHSLNTDYKFDLDTMLSLEGNTAPYLQYAYARIRSIARKAEIAFEDLPADTPLLLEHPAEIRLARTIARLPDTLGPIAEQLKPNLLTDYLYELSKAFSRFYDRKLGVRVIDASPDEVRLSRLRLCDLTARTLRLGLELLGIGVVERM